MTKFNVHIYREMKLLFMGVEADTPEAAAEIAEPLTLNDAVYQNCVEECEGQTFAALVDVVGDKDYSLSRVVEFEPELQRKAAPKLLRALEMASNYLGDDLDECDETEMRVLNTIAAAIAAARAIGILPAPATVEAQGEEA